MNFSFKYYFLIFNLILITIISYVLAKIVSISIFYYLEGCCVTYYKNKKINYNNTKFMKSNFNIVAKKNIFKTKREEIIPTNIKIYKEDIKTINPNSWQKAVLSNLKVKLIGTAVFSNHNKSLASIEDFSNKKDVNVKNYSINKCENYSLMKGVFGETILNKNFTSLNLPCNKLAKIAVIKRIEVDKVFIFNETKNRFEYFGFKNNKKSIDLSNNFSNDLLDTYYIGENIRKTSNNSYEIEQKELNNILLNISKIVVQARSVPVLQNNKIIGFKILGIKKKSIFEKLGLKNGDIIKKINEYNLNSIDVAIELYQKLKSYKNFNIKLNRYNHSIILNYCIIP